MNPVTENTKTDKKQSMKLEIKLAVTLDDEVVTMLFLNLNDFMSNFILKKIHQATGEFGGSKNTLYDTIMMDICHMLVQIHRQATKTEP